MAVNQNKYKRRWGDRRDGRRVKVSGMQTIMASLWPKRTDCEVYLHDTIDVTEMMKYVERKNAEHPDLKTTKKDMHNHGMGIGIIKNIASRYNGRC